MNEDFKPGDVVRLKSGGPRMTVTKVQLWESEMNANCEWFEGTEPQSRMFTVSSLKKAEEMTSAASSIDLGAWR